MKAIRRPRTLTELLDPMLHETKAASKSAIEPLEVADIGGSSSTADTDCLVCLEKL